MVMLTQLLAVLILVAGLIALIHPAIVLKYLAANKSTKATYVIAIIVRVVVGLLLVYLSNLSKFPFVISVIGWLFLISAAGLALLGHSGFKRLIAWVLQHLSNVARFGGALAILLGAFIFYSFT